MTRKTVGIITTSELSKAGAPSQRTAESYVHTVARMCEATPLLIPAVPQVHDIAHLLEILDGIVLTGARPNVHPREWGEGETEAHAPFDRDRDRLALPLVRAAVDAGVPLFGICRGLQEMNVAFGGTLHPEIRDLPGRQNHRMLPDVPRADRYAIRHAVRLTGTMADLYGTREIHVNSLHGQGILDSAPRILVEGVADDQTIEAVRVADAPGFAIGVQWHAEHAPWEQAVNAPLWRAFAAAMAGRGDQGATSAE